MNAETSSSLASRARVHAALGDQHRLAVVDALRLSDHTPSELRELTGLSSNLLAFHLRVLEQAGLVRRTRSQGDGRRRYVQLVCDVFPAVDAPRFRADAVVFVCTANAARSQIAAALWAARTGQRPLSAGTRPAERVHPLAAEIAHRHGLDLAGTTPRHLDDLEAAPDLVVSVCDRARESDLAPSGPTLHWSVADPVGGRITAFERAYQQLARRVDRLAPAVTPPPATRESP